MAPRLDGTPADFVRSELGGAAKRGQGQAAAAPSGPRPDAGGSHRRGAEQRRRSRPERGARRASRRDSAGRPQPAARRWGAKPRAPAKRGYPPGRFRNAEVRAAGPQAIASSDGGAAPSAARAAGRCEASPPRRVAALCAAPPRTARSAVLEPEGREGAVRRADAASSRGSVGEAAQAAGAKRRPTRCSTECASSRTGSPRPGTESGTPYVDPRRNGDVPTFVGAKA